MKRLANGYTLACSNQTGQIAVEGVGGECGLTLGDVLRLRAGEHYAQNLAHGYRIIAKRLVEIAHTEQQNRIGVLGLLDVLFQGKYIVCDILLNYLNVGDKSLAILHICSNLAP